MSIRVNDFQWQPGTNDAEYIKLLESSRDEWERIAQKAISKLKTLSKAQEPIETRLHLCESCTKKYPECDATADGVEFGNGTGNDNIIGCTAYTNRWKAQEPRLVTPEDFKNADEYGFIPVWCEETNKNCYWNCIPKSALETAKEDRCRYWTAKPSLKQMEETPWEKECISKQALS